jgi:flagellar basal body-associated protein FliL
MKTGLIIIILIVVILLFMAAGWYVMNISGRVIREIRYRKGC